MYVLVGLFGLIALIFVRPQEFVDVFRAVPLLYVFFGLAIAGFLFDLSRGTSRLRMSPQLPWVLAFVVWCLFTLVFRQLSAIPSALMELSILLAIYAAVGHGVQGFRGLESVSAMILCCALFISGAMVEEGMASPQCVAVEESSKGDVQGKPDGRACKLPEDCQGESAEEGVIYRCEQVGVFGNTTVGNGRVRWVGKLQDPNETALAVTVPIPLAFAFYRRKRSKWRVALLGLTILLGAVVTVMTKSRGGQLIFLTVLGAYFLERYGKRGLAVASALAVPVLLLGGRGGVEASQSSQERLECWYAGVQMFLSNPVLGVGYGRYTEFHYLTAHNSYVLAAAELGLPGMLIFSALVYLSMKAPLTVLRTAPVSPEGAQARIWAMTLLAAFAGISVGVFFLSFNYHQVLWVFLGLSAALWSSFRSAFPGEELKLTWRELAGLLVADLVLMAVLWGYTTVRLARGG